MHDNSVRLKESEREALAKAYAEYVKKHGEPKLMPSNVFAEQAISDGRIKGHGFNRRQRDD